MSRNIEQHILCIISEEKCGMSKRLIRSLSLPGKNKSDGGDSGEKKFLPAVSKAGKGIYIVPNTYHNLMTYFVTSFHV